MLPLLKRGSRQSRAVAACRESPVPVPLPKTSRGERGLLNFRKIWLKRGALFALDLHEPHAPQPSSSAQNPFLRQGRLSQSPVTSPAGEFWLKRQLLPQPAPCREGWSQRWQSWGCIAPTPRLALLCCWAKFLLPQCNVRFALLVSVSAHWDHTPPPCPQGSTLLAQQKTCKVCPGFWRDRGCARAIAVGLFTWLCKEP